MSKLSLYLLLTGLLMPVSNVVIAQDDDLDFLFEGDSDQQAPSAQGNSDKSSAPTDGQIRSEPASPAPDPAPSNNTSADQLQEPRRQAPERSGVARGSRSRLIEEIVVTAQKREENLSDVPISINAYSGEKLDALGIESVQDLERVTPGFTVTQTNSFNIAYLRGVGTDAFLPGADSSVPFYIDGVALVTGAGSTDTLGRVERVEVLKGPQGTLFGRNSTGGAISIITPEPNKDEWTGDLQLGLAEFGERNVQAYISGPLIDGLAFSLSGYSNERDNYFTNEVGSLLDIEARGGRAKLQWEATDSLEFTLAGSISETSNNGGLAMENTRPAPVLGAGTPADPNADRNVRLDFTPGTQTESHLLSLTAQWQLPWFDIKLIGSDQKQEAPFVQQDFDASEQPLVNILSIEQIVEQRTAELQFLSNADTPFSDRFEWVGGLYYLESAGGFDPLRVDLFPKALGALGVPGGQVLTDTLTSLLTGAGVPARADRLSVFNGGVLVSESLSAYFQGTYSLIPETLDLTLGLRYQQEDRDLVRSRLSVPDAEGNEMVVREDNVPTLEATQYSPKVALKWNPFGGRNQVFASWARGFKSPTYNTVNILDGPEAINEEKVDSYELGFKSQFFNGSLGLNGAVFFIQQEDLLTAFVSLASGGAVSYENAGNAEIRGAETDFIWSPMPNLNPGLVITGSAAYLDTEYTSYPDGSGYDEDTGISFGNDSPGDARNFTGNRIVRTPEITYTLGVNQRFSFGPGDVEVGVDTYYNDGFFFLAQNSDLYARDDYQLFSARISYFYDPWGLQVTAFGENITDETYIEAVYVSDFGRNQVLNPPRIFGIRGKWSF